MNKLVIIFLMFSSLALAGDQSHRSDDFLFSSHSTPARLESIGCAATKSYLVAPYDSDCFNYVSIDGKYVRYDLWFKSNQRQIGPVNSNSPVAQTQMVDPRWQDVNVLLVDPGVREVVVRMEFIRGGHYFYAYGSVSANFKPGTKIRPAGKITGNKAELWLEEADTKERVSTASRESFSQ